MKLRDFFPSLTCPNGYEDSGRIILELLKGKGIITPIQRDLLIEFGKIPETALFYVTGGTALAEG